MSHIEYKNQILAAIAAVIEVVVATTEKYTTTTGKSLMKQLSVCNVGVPVYLIGTALHAEDRDGKFVVLDLQIIYAKAEEIVKGLKRINNDLLSAVVEEERVQKVRLERITSLVA